MLQATLDTDQQTFVVCAFLTLGSKKFGSKLCLCVFQNLSRIRFFLAFFKLQFFNFSTEYFDT
jgi:hypothetical protein